MLIAKSNRGNNFFATIGAAEKSAGGEDGRPEGASIRNRESAMPT